jgi:hypothetical protein
VGTVAIMDQTGTAVVKVSGRALLIVFPATPDRPEQKVLTLDITMDCDACGHLVLRLPGHHLRALHHILGEYITEFNDDNLIGSPAVAEDKFKFETQRKPPTDPSVN